MSVRQLLQVLSTVLFGIGQTLPMNVILHRDQQKDKSFT